MSLKVLVITPDFPYPANHGGRVDYYNRIKCLSELGLELHLISTVSEDITQESISEMERYVSKIFIVKRNNSILNLFSLTPFQILSRKELSKLFLNNVTYDFILLDSEYVISILENQSFKYRNSYLRIHNLESKYFYSLALSTLPKISSLYYFTEAFKFFRFNNKINGKFNKLLFISSEELEQTKINEKCIHLLPVYSVNDNMKMYTKKESKLVLFIGSLFMPNNLESLEFYLKNVHNKLTEIEGYRFIVVGSTKSNKQLQKKILSRYKNYNAIDFHFDVKTSEIDSFYEKSRVFVNPVLHGAGVKMKVLEAIRNGMPVVSTSVGASGTGLINDHEIIITNEPQEMADKIRHILSDLINEKKLVSNAQNKITKSYEDLAGLFTAHALTI